MDELETNHQQENKQAGFAMQEKGTVMKNDQEESEEPKYNNDWEDAFEAEEERREAEHAAAKQKHAQMIADKENAPNKKQKRVKWSAQFNDGDEKTKKTIIKQH
eukprot:7896811-Ditylum_brightwellii.AAC.1